MLYFIKCINFLLTFALMNPFRTLLVFCLLSLVGAFLASRLPVKLRPETQAPGLAVAYALPDAPPTLVEQQVTAPLKNALSRLEGRC
ncbi:MAG: efflux RND transporter permease subunit [Catalinimonas sp.]